VLNFCGIFVCFGNRRVCCNGNIPINKKQIIFKMIRLFFCVLVVSMLTGSIRLYAQTTAVTSPWGKGTRTVYSNGITATTSPWGNGTRTVYSNGITATTSTWGNGTKTTYSNGITAINSSWGNGTKTSLSNGANLTTSSWGNGTRTTSLKGDSAITSKWGNGTRTTYSGNGTLPPVWNNSRPATRPAR
jgi:hypothetical protein